jgi:Cof subfamily protein (haloacid dehalogenase superfamily)
MRIDLVALDIDGTLLGPDDRVSARNKRAIRGLLELGVRVVLVTGRGVDLPSKLSRDLGLNLPIICCHGALTKDFHANRILNELPVPLVYAKPMVEYAEAHGLSIALYSDESFWRLEGSRIYMDDMTGPHWREAKRFSDVLDRAPTFMRFLGAEAVAAMEREFGDYPLSFRHEQWHDFVECAVLNRDASKRNALARLCADFQILPDRVLAIGDSRNDVPMLRWAKIGIAMGNALPEVRESVRYVTGTNAEDGVALALERFVPELVRKPA